MNPGLPISRKNSRVAVKNVKVNGTLLLGHPEGRRAVIQSGALRGGIQVNHTPWVVINRMLSKVELSSAKSILILFNLEFLEVIFTEHPEVMGKITFMADSILEQEFAQKVYGVNTLYVKEDSWKKISAGKVTKETWRRLMKMNGAADITLTNPPYNRNIDLKIIKALEKASLLRRVVCVHPSNWLVDLKGSNKVYEDFKNGVSPHLISLTMFNGNPVFDIGLFVPCVITDMDFGWVRKSNSWIDVSYVGEEYTHKVTGTEEVTLHGESWRTCVKEFFEKMQGECATRGNLWNKRITGWSPTTSNAVQLAAIIGHWTASSDLKMVKDDFYTFVQKNPGANKGIRQGDPSRAGNPTPTYKFSNPSEQDNFISYLQTDFARLCLSLLKTNQNLATGSLALVPWMDFTRSWTDDDLFSGFGYPPGHPIREYAKKFIPDYHNLYPNGKSY